MLPVYWHFIRIEENLDKIKREHWAPRKYHTIIIVPCRKILCRIYGRKVRRILVQILSFLYCHPRVDLSGYHYCHTTQLPPTKMFRLEYAGWAKKVSVHLLWSKVANCKLKGHHENLVVNNNVNSCTFVLLSVNQRCCLESE